MKLSEIIQLADLLLGTKVDSNVFVKTSMDAELSSYLSQKPLSLLCECANLTLAEIACDYIQLCYKEVIVSNGIIDYKAFTKDVLSVLRIEDNKQKIKFRYTSSGVETDKGGKFEVIYTYKPKKCGFLDEVEKSVAITDRLIAYGIASEYCLLSGMYDEASIWDKRYKDALRCSARKGEIKILPRLFV
ncbi:MAG: hypothetical protein RR248_04050 [Clostridia bacterium]